MSRYAIYVQDYGANGYDEGFVESFWTRVWAYQREQTPETEAGVRTALSVDGIKATNAPLYPALHEYLRTSRVPVLAVWGEGDPIFGPDGARAFGKDAIDAEIHLLDGGHFYAAASLTASLTSVRNLRYSGERRSS